METDSQRKNFPWTLLIIVWPFNNGEKPFAIGGIKVLIKVVWKASEKQSKILQALTIGVCEAR